MSTKLKILDKPVRRPKNVTAQFMELYKGTAKGTVFEVIDLEGDSHFFMKFTQNYMMRLNGTKHNFHYNKNNNELVGKKLGNTAPAVPLFISVGEFREVNAEIHVS